MKHWLTEKVQEAATGGASQVLLVLEESRTLLISDTSDTTTSFRTLAKGTDAYTHLKVVGEPVQIFNAVNQVFESEDDFSVYTDLVRQDRYKIIEVFSADAVEQAAIKAARRSFPSLEVCDFRAPAAIQFDVAQRELPQDVSRRLQELLALETDIATRDAYGMAAARNNTLPFRLPMSMACRIHSHYTGSGLQDSCRELLENQVLSRQPRALPEVPPGMDFVTVSVLGHDGLFEEVDRISQTLQAGYQATCLGLLLEGLTEIEKPAESGSAGESESDEPDMEPDVPEQEEAASEGPTEDLDEVAEVDEVEEEEEGDEGVNETLSDKIKTIGIRPIELNERRSGDEVRQILQQVIKGWRPLTPRKSVRLNSFIRSYPFMTDVDVVTSLRRAQFSDDQAQVVARFLTTVSYKETAKELGMDPQYVRKTCLSVFETLSERQARPDRSPTMALVRLSFDLALENPGVLASNQRSTDRGTSGRIRAWFSERGKSGGTTPECSQALGLNTSFVSAVAVQLIDSGFLKETGRKRGAPKSKVRVAVLSV